MKHRKMTKQQKANATKSARRHGRSRPGLWENVNASKGRGPKAKKKGETKPGRRSKTQRSGSQKRRARRRSS